LQMELDELKKVVDLKVTDPKGIELRKELFEDVSQILDRPNWSLM
jgi:hypothetical protein